MGVGVLLLGIAVALFIFAASFKLPKGPMRGAASVVSLVVLLIGLLMSSIA